VRADQLRDFEVREYVVFGGEFLRSVVAAAGGGGGAIGLVELVGAVVIAIGGRG
jgi:hypothetical protein